MAKKDAIVVYRDQWLNIDKLKFPGNIGADDVEAAVILSSVSIDLEIIVPKEFASGEGSPAFDPKKSPELKKYRATLEDKAIDALSSIVEAHRDDREGDEEAFQEATKTVSSINGYLKKAFGDLRVVIRTAIAKSLDGKVKADDLQTAGWVEFEELTLRPGAFENEVSFDSPMLDLSKALKRKKWQECGVAWKADACVISVKPKKEFKEPELKELREKLPDGKDKGAKMLNARFKADSATKITIEFPEKVKKPTERLLRQALQEQTGKIVTVTRITGDFQTGKNDMTNGNTKTEGTPKSSAKSNAKTAGKSKGRAEGRN